MYTISQLNKMEEMNKSKGNSRKEATMQNNSRREEYIQLYGWVWI